MLRYVGLLAAVLASLASCGAGSANGAEPQPGRCCLPNQYSIYMFPIQTTLTSGVLTVFDTQVDYDRKQQAMLIFAGSFQAPVSRIVIDYAKKMMYTVPPNDTSCSKTPLELPMIRCIPDDAEHLGEGYMGPMEADQLPYDGYTVRAPMGNSSVIFTLAISKTGCVPLVQGISFPDDPDQNQSYMFSNFRTGLSNPTAFDLPASCFNEVPLI